MRDSTRANPKKRPFANQKEERTMADYQTLLVDKKDGVTTITLNRPEKRNAMSPQLHREMYDCLNDLRYDKDTRVIIITGAGESFCAGQDLKQYFIEMDSQPLILAITGCGILRRISLQDAATGDRQDQRLGFWRRLHGCHRLR